MKAKLSIIAATLSVLLSACGGGGGDSATGNTPVGGTPTTPVPAPTPVPTTPPVVVTPPPSDLQTSVPAATYLASSQEMAFYSALNDFRAKVGLGLLAQNTALDQAAKNHVNYVLTNTDVNFSAVDPKTGRAMFHIEETGRAGFTGVQEADRAKAAGYVGTYVGESGAYGMGGGGLNVFNSLLGAVYHRQGLMFQEQRDIGIAIGNDASQTAVIELGYMTTPQSNASNFMGVYPADKETNIPLASYPELPNPFPELTTYDAIKAGTSFPISVIGKSFTTLTVKSFTVKEQGQSAPLPAWLFTSQNDPNKLVQSNAAFLVARGAFKPNTTYTVEFIGTVNGKDETKTWSFTTASK